MVEASKEMGHSKVDIPYRMYYKWLPQESRSDVDELDYGWSEDAAIRNLSATKNDKGASRIG